MVNHHLLIGIQDKNTDSDTLLHNAIDKMINTNEKFRTFTK